jgi:hypothetical protein
MCLGNKELFQNHYLKEIVIEREKKKDKGVETERD